MDAARGYLHDTLVPGGAVWTNTNLQTHFNEAYRQMYNCLAMASKRIQKVIYIPFPAYTTVLIPASYQITDFSEPEIIEERPMPSTPIAIVSTDTSTPINVTTISPHGLSSNAEVIVSEVIGTPSPWGQWFITVTGASTLSLNGSASDGNTGTGGTLVAGTAAQPRWSPVNPLDLDKQGIDGQPQAYLGVYIWGNEQLRFRGATNQQELRITYWASGTPPTNASQQIGIDNCIDFLACATAASAARANSWFQLADQLKFTAYGPEQQGNGDGGLLRAFLNVQVTSMQRGPQRRMLPFRNKKSRFGNYNTLG